MKNKTTLSLSLSLSHTHTHTHTNTLQHYERKNTKQSFIADCPVSLDSPCLFFHAMTVFKRSIDHQGWPKPCKPLVSSTREKKYEKILAVTLFSLRILPSQETHVTLCKNGLGRRFLTILYSQLTLLSTDFWYLRRRLLFTTDIKKKQKN